MGSILDRAQTLFGRAFLIAAFVPSVFFVLCNSILYWGFSALNQHVRDLAKWKENVLELSLWLLITYLLAYILYGTRAFLQQIYQGAWQITISFKSLSWLEWLVNRPYRIGIWITTHRMRRYREIAEEKVALFDWPLWILEEDFGKTFSTKKLTSGQVTQELSSLKKKHQAIISTLEKKKTLSEHAFWDLLARAQVLSANLKRLESDPALKGEVTRFIETLKREFHFSEYKDEMRASVERFRGAADRAWASAQGSFLANFPGDERWTRATQLGALAAVNDLYPLRRYGISLSNLWPRLVQIVSDDVRQRLEDANIYLDFTMIMSFLSAALVASSLCLAKWQHNSHLHYPRNIFVPLFFFVSFLAFYRLAIGATRVFGLQVQACVDLFRLKLLDALDIERPVTLADERTIWNEIHFFIEQGEVPASIRLKAKIEEVPKMPPWWMKLYQALIGKRG